MSAPAGPPPTPRWVVWILVVAVATIALLLGAHLLTGGGPQHGP